MHCIYRLQWTSHHKKAAKRTLPGQQSHRKRESLLNAIALLHVNPEAKVYGNDLLLLGVNTIDG